MAHVQQQLLYWENLCEFCGFLHAIQTLTKQRLPNLHISMITSNIAIKLKCWAIVHDTNWPLYYTMVSILQCPKTPKQVFVAKYLFLEQNKQIWDEPLCSGHLSIADTFSQSQCYPLKRGFIACKTAFLIKVSLFLKTVDWTPTEMSFQETFDINYNYYCKSANIIFLFHLKCYQSFNNYHKPIWWIYILYTPQEQSSGT